MPVLIDGNNLLFAAYDEDPERPIARSRLCELLGRWGRRIGEPVSVVFDGPEPEPALAAQLALLGVQLTFSGERKADDVLAEVVRGHSAPRRLAVVSTDREVARAARRRDAVALRSDHFWRIVLEDLARPPAQRLEPIEKRAGLAVGEADEWLRDLGLENFDPSRDLPERRRPKRPRD